MGWPCAKQAGLLLRTLTCESMCMAFELGARTDRGTHAGYEFFRFVVECAGTEGTRAAELYHWSAMAFGEHWRRLVAVELGRGRLSCLRRAAGRGYGGNSVPSAETAPDSL